MNDMYIALNMFINASIPNPGEGGPSMNYWNSSADIPYLLLN